MSLNPQLVVLDSKLVPGKEQNEDEVIANDRMTYCNNEDF